MTLLALAAVGFVLLGAFAIVLKAIGLFLNLVLLPVKIVLGGMLAIGALIAGVFLLPVFLVLGVLGLVGVLAGGVLLLGLLF